MSEFFWEIVLQSDKYREELVENCIVKFAEMVRYWDLDRKKPFFFDLTRALGKEQSIVPVLRLFTKLVRDQVDRVTATSYSNSSSSYVNSYSNVTPAGGVVTSYSY